MRIHLLMLLFVALVGCAESRADRPAYVPPDTDQAADDSAADPFEPGHNPDCVCDNCDCDPCECGSQTPEPVPQAFAMRPGYQLSLVSPDWCVNCPAAKAAADESGVPVEVVDADADAPRAAELLASFPYRIRSFPLWVLSVDGRPVNYWSGLCDADSVRAMASWEHAAPPRQTASSSGYHLKRGDPHEPVIDNGLVLPDGRVILPDAEGYPDAYAPPYESQTPTQSHHSDQPSRAPVRRFFGGCSGGRCYGGCANGRCG